MAQTAAERNAAAEEARKAEKRRAAMAEFEASLAKDKAKTEARDTSALVEANSKAPPKAAAPAATPKAAAPSPRTVRDYIKDRAGALNYADGGRVFPKGKKK